MLTDQAKKIILEDSKNFWTAFLLIF